MAKKIDNDEYERLKQLKQDFDLRRITESELTDEDSFYLSKMYDMQIKNLGEEITKLEQKIKDYEKRMKEAIDYLNNMKNTAK